MEKRGDEFLKSLFATFRVEAAEHIRALSVGLIELEKATRAEKQIVILESIFREAHSLKGAARAVNVTELEAVCQRLENVFAALKRKDIGLTPALLNVLHNAVDALDKWLRTIDTERTSVGSSLMVTVLRNLESAVQGSPTPSVLEPSPPLATEKPILADTVRIATAKLDSVLTQAEELLVAKLALGERVAELRAINAATTRWEKEWTKIHSDVRAIQDWVEQEDNGNGWRNKNPHLQRLLGFLEWDSTFNKSLQARLEAQAKVAEQDHRSLGRMVDTLLEDTKKLLMLPSASLLEMVPKFVRDLSQDKGKDIELAIEGGGEIEIDRRILEEMRDPLIHLVRNCVDHGIEKPEERGHRGKPRRGRVRLAITQLNGNKVEILASDDGAGINVTKVRAAAVRLGLVPPEETDEINDAKVLSLIFESGVSTSSIVTDLSGRGLGLAIVREKVEKLGGTVSVETRSEAGTTFRIVLPLTVATFRGLIVDVDAHMFVFPTTSVERVARVRREEIRTVENRETIRLGSEAVSLVRLVEVLDLPTQKSTQPESEERMPVVVLRTSDKRIAFLVDGILGEQEVLVKTFGAQLSRVRNISGAAMLGTGQVVLVLNVPDLMKSAVRARGEERGVVSLTPLEREEEKKQSILVVEDSITARTLLKNILEAAGYDVKTAVDGVDAFTALRAEEFTLVVSDVDMPRMNGFDLTTKIRTDKKLAELPVVLVTALESREDRERGIDVGANAYIVKSSFDQSNLLAVIRRFI